MRAEDLFEAIGQMDDRFVEEGREAPAVKKMTWKKALAAAAALAIVAGLGIWAVPKITPKPAGGYIEKHVPAPELNGDIPEIYRVPHWEDMRDVQRYASLSFDGIEYVTKVILVHAENVGAELGVGTFAGQDNYTDEIHTLEGRVFEVKGVNTEAAVCAEFPDEPGRAYAYINAMYTPATLGQFIDDLNLRETLSTGLVYVKRGAEPDVVYEDIGTEMIWQQLLSDAVLANEPEAAPGPAVLSISAGIDLLGYHDHTITLTEDGYLWTNLLESGKYFRIGEEKVQAFVKEVTENHQGYIYIYDDAGDPVPEAGEESRVAETGVEEGVTVVQTAPAE